MIISKKCQTLDMAQMIHHFHKTYTVLVVTHIVNASLSTSLAARWSRGDAGGGDCAAAPPPPAPPARAGGPAGVGCWRAGRHPAGGPHPPERSGVEAPEPAGPPPHRHTPPHPEPPGCGPRRAAVNLPTGGPPSPPTLHLGRRTKVHPQRPRRPLPVPISGGFDLYAGALRTCRSIPSLCPPPPPRGALPWAAPLVPADPAAVAGRPCPFCPS